MTTKAKKKPFEWDTEEHLGFVEVTDRMQYGITRVTLRGKEYINITEWKYFTKDNEDQWNAVKGRTILTHLWDDINNIVQESFEEDPPQEPNTDDEGE